MQQTSEFSLNSLCKNDIWMSHPVEKRVLKDLDELLFLAQAIKHIRL